MGDRVLFQIVGREEVSPVIYCHWAGSLAPDIARRLAARMASRPGDVPYAAARLVQECATGTGSTGFGVWNTLARLTAEDSHGDAGVVLIDCDSWRCECLGGYLVTGADGFPMHVERAA
jgi:hypothetical protein